MKKLHKLAAAASLALVAGNASAALSDGHTSGSPSSVLLGIVDQTAGANYGYTFLLDLGLTYDQFVKNLVANGTSWNLSSYAGFSAFAGHDLVYSVSGSYSRQSASGRNNVNSLGVNFTDPSGTQWGAISTAAHGVSDFAAKDYRTFTDAAGASTTTAAATGGTIPNWLNQSSPFLGGDGSSVVALGTEPGAESFYKTNFSLGQAIAPGGSASIGGYDVIAKFFWLTNDSTSTLANNDFFELGSFKLGTNNVLTFNTPGGASPVPLPASVWLLASTLLGWLGLARRQDKKVTALAA